MALFHPRGARFLAWRAYFLEHPGASERYPFYPDVPVYFVKKKMFGLYANDGRRDSINLKCHPDWAADLRRDFKDIVPGFHMNKKHWNTVYPAGEVPRPLVKKMIDHSYDLVSGRLKSLGKPEAKSIKPRGV